MKKAVVVGSGPGGCMAARELSATFDVTVLEAGGAFSPFKYRPESFELPRRAGLFFDERMIQLLYPEMRIYKARSGLVHVNGRCVGGTSQLATGNAVACDGALRDIGVDLSAEFDELAAEVPMTREHYRRWSDLTVRLFDAFEQLGYDPQVTSKFMHSANACAACGRCVLGCRHGAKWTADELLKGCASVELRSGVCAERVIIADGQALGVRVRERGGRRADVPADLVVLSAGGLGTPCILNASGIQTVPRLFVDPIICVAATWPGARLDAQLPMPFVSQRDGYILSPYFDWLSFFFDKAWRRPAHDIMSIMVKYADSECGAFDGRHLRKPVTPHDERTIARSVEEAKQVLDCMGVSRDEMFLGVLNAGHPGGCLPLSAEQATTLHHDALPGNLYVADASLLPHSMGNPPTLTIMALAKRVARLAARK